MTQIKRYRQLCQKNAAENYLLDKFIVRHISIFFTILFIKLKISANTATVLSLAASLGSLFFLLFNSRPMMITAAALIFAYYILDHVDGELARYYINTGVQQPSLKGQYFDLLVHRYSSNLMVLFIGISIYRYYGYELAVLIGFFAAVGISSFPNVIAAQVLMGRIARGPRAVDSDRVKEILNLLEGKKQQISLMQGAGLLQIKKAIGEIFFFPGHIIMIIFVILADALFKEGFIFLSYPVNFRLLMITAMAGIFSAKSVIQGYMWIKRFKEIS